MERAYSAVHKGYYSSINTFLIIALFSGINRSLKNAKAVKEGGNESEPKTFYEAIAEFATARKKLFGIIVILVIATLSKAPVTGSTFSFSLESE